ncbi:MAG TPA: ABC transporter ATP-binding protein [Myxococcaceae bacterium]|nr:ABC transporter ATP-binding protein [Myxococcaceae bacterium]
MEPVLRLERLSAGYGRRSVLHEVSFTVQSGQLWVVLGPNGAGKSTLLRTCLGLHPPISGEIHLLGTPLERWKRREVARQVAWVAQSLDGTIEFTGLELVLMGRSPHLGLWGLPAAADVQRAMEIMSELGVAHLASRPADAISGGERRLLLLARALVQEPRLLVLDEPTAFLDLKHQAHVMAKLKSRTRMGLAVLAVVHDLNQAAAFADRALLLKEGTVLACGETARTLLDNLLERLYETPIASASAGAQALFAPRLTP